MARMQGYTGQVRFDTEAVPDWADAAEILLAVTKYDITDEADVLETTGMDSSGKATYLGGVTRWSGTINAYWEDEMMVGAPPDLAPGTVINVRLDLTGASAGTDNWTGVCVVRSAKPEVSVDGVVSYTLDVQGTGTLTRPS